MELKQTFQSNRLNEYELKTGSEEKVAPAQMFDGRFFLTNPYDEDFTGKWDNVEYTFPAKSSVPLVILSATPLETEGIRKKFAKELGLREYFKSEDYQRRLDKKYGVTPQTYTEREYAPYVQKCLQPLPVTILKSKKIEVVEQEKKQFRGKDIVKIVDEKESLVGEALNDTR